MTPCPTAGQLREMLDGRLPPEQEQPVAEHVECCSHCQNALEELTSATVVPLPPPADPSPTHPHPDSLLAPLRWAGPSFDHARTQIQVAGEPLADERADPTSRRFWPSVPGYEIVGELGR